MDNQKLLISLILEGFSQNVGSKMKKKCFLAPNYFLNSKIQFLGLLFKKIKQQFKVEDFYNFLFLFIFQRYGQINQQNGQNKKSPKIFKILGDIRNVIQLEKLTCSIWTLFKSWMTIKMQNKLNNNFTLIFNSTRMTRDNNFIFLYVLISE
eukprot:TRINITY_DN3803_c0_g1_i4.p3 TRINITY_DN3803_c0_g1~~TRINITY_DN3803_c0_g1_i4.p3  ORF type:complete len:151 (-),score=7.46 TRINITY_DN3803_c0_g1_i4:285-737(-)